MEYWGLELYTVNGELSAGFRMFESSIGSEVKELPPEELEVKIEESEALLSDEEKGGGVYMVGEFIFEWWCW